MNWKRGEEGRERGGRGMRKEEDEEEWGRGRKKNEEGEGNKGE